jgi:hypothetical protein
MKNIEGVLDRAAVADEAELSSLVHHPSHAVVLKMLLNENLTEKLALIIAGRKNIGAEVLETLYNDPRWEGSSRIMLALCKNPKTPQKISLSLLKSLRTFDTADLTRNPQVPVNVRKRAESKITEKILSLPLGTKMTLARRSSNAVLMKLIEDGMKEVVTICLDSMYIREGDVCKIVSMKKISSQVISQIASHAKWSLRHDVQRALLLNNHTPLAIAIHFIEKMKTVDLAELYVTPSLPSSTKPFIYRELRERNTDVPEEEDGL